MLTMNNKKHPPEVFYKKAALKNFSIFTGKRLCWSLFLIKLQVLAYRKSGTQDYKVRPLGGTLTWDPRLGP